jgi:hypothetical protein
MKKILITAAVLICGMLSSLEWSTERGLTLSFCPESAQAVIGRPATPRSVAGAARRTTRRAVRRSYYHY